MALMSNSIQNHAGNSSASVPSSARTRTFRSGNATVSLQEGQVLKGVVSDVHGNELTLSMEDGSSFTGKLPEASQYSIGQKAAFQIMNLESNTIYMKAMGDTYLLDMEDTIEQALEEANLPKSQRNLDVVRSLLQNQRSISRESILSSIRLCAKFPQADVHAVITMERLRMPMTKESVQQFENYQNQNENYTLLHQMNTLQDSLHDMLTAIGTQVPRFAKQVGTQLLQLALEGNPTPAERNLGQQGEPMMGEAGQAGTFAGQEVEQAVQEQTDIQRAEQEMKAAENESARNGQETATPLAKMKQLFTSLAENTIGKVATEVTEPVEQSEAFIPEQTGAFLRTDEREMFSTFLREYPLTDEVRQGLAEGSLTAREFLQAIVDTFPHMTEEQAGKLISAKPFQAIVRAQFTSNWTVSPEQLKEENAMDEMYGRLSRQIKELSQFSEQVLGKNVFTEMTGQAQSMKDNLDFMKLLNQSFQYMQLPLQLQQQKAHGDLYVMTRKESLKKDPNHVKVLLHLDMEHLGTLDIQLAKENTAVSTRFYVEEKSVLRLLERNIGLLSDALNEQGYAFTSEISLQEKKIDIVKDFMAADSPVGDIKRYNFDLRA